MKLERTLFSQQPFSTASEIGRHLNCLTTPAPDWLNLKYSNFAGPNPGRIKWIDLGTQGTLQEFVTGSNTVVGHSAATQGIAVAAAPYFNHHAAESFSSFGPTNILFDAAGNRLSVEQVRQTPQLTATDGTETTFFGQLADFDGDGTSTNYFFGTSAAAPNAAAVAALILDANPEFTPAQIYQRMISTATDIAVPGFDNITGAGLINAWDAIVGDAVPATLEPVGASLEYSETFESGFLSTEWEIDSDGGGRIRVVDNNASGGSQRLSLDAASAGFGPSSLNEAILHLDLDGLSSVQLQFDQREFGDEDNLSAGDIRRLNKC